MTIIHWKKSYDKRSSVQLRSVAQSSNSLCPMNRSTAGLPVHQQLPESTQNHVHQVSDAIQPCHPLSSPSPPALSLSQDQGLFKRVSTLQQFSSVQSRLTLCDSMNHSMPGLPVHHQLPESAQTHVHRVGDAIQPSHPLSSPSPPALSLSQDQGLFK